MRVDTEAVNSELLKIDNIVDEIQSLCDSTESDISPAWNSANAKANVTPKIDAIKQKITDINDIIKSVREHAGIVVSDIEETDASMNGRN